MAVADLEAGTRIGEYTVAHDLGSGGMGAVYLAHDAGGREVVLKFPHINMIGDPALYERYQRELTIGKTLRHSHIQHVLDSGEYRGHPYMVTEYVEGETLRAFLEQHGALAIPEALRLLDQLCDALAYCHEHGVIHRDLKPENILITPSRDVTIIDFGIALLRGARRITWAGLSSTVGTPDYMAPEQIQGKRGDARTDEYAIACIGYEALSGRPPFTGDNPLAVMNQHLYGTIRPLPDLNSTVPAELDHVIQKALRRDPDQRFASVTAFREALANYQQVGAAIGPTTQRKPLLSRHPQVRRVLVYTLVIGAIFVGIILLGFLAQIAHTAH